MIAIRNVHKKFASVTAVDGISFGIDRNEIFALLGPNGAGKTTLLRMLLGLMHPDSGEIEFDGGKQLPEPSQVGYLPEDRGLYPDAKVVDTLIHFGALRGMERRAARTASMLWLERMQLADRAREPLKALSKGNQQKIQFISAILHSPSLAFLDEPFSGLDPLNQDLFLSLIEELRNGGTTVVLSAHQMQLVERIANRVIVMNRGRAVLQGSIADVRRRWTTGHRLVVHVTAPPPADFPQQSPAAVVRIVDPERVEVFLPEEAEFAPLLAEIGDRLAVRDIESHPVTLHDVYVQAIARHNAGELQ